MTKDEAESLARRMRPGNAILENAWPSVNASDLRRLCDHILSGDHKREIENAAFERAVMAVRAFRINPPYTAAIVRDSACDAINALIQPPAQKEAGK